MRTTSSLIGRVYRCAWCHKAAPVAGGLLYYTYTNDDSHGRRQAAPADPSHWDQTDGICPAHLAAVL